MIEYQPGEVTLIFHSDKAEDRKTRAYVENLDGYYIIKSFDLKWQTLTEGELVDVAGKLGVAVVDLVDTEYSDRMNVQSVKSLKEQDTLRLLSDNPMLLATPILVIGNYAFHFENT